MSESVAHDRTDEQARLQSLDGKRSFIVRAPAGSGKTELLVQRLLALLTRVDAPEEILAVTFTRKAAAAMRARVLAALKAAAEGTETEKPHERLSQRLAQAVLGRDRDLKWNLLQNPLRLRIQTIDALCASLARQLPVLSGFGSPPAITEDVDQLYREASRRLLQSIGDDEIGSVIQSYLLHVDGFFPTAEDLLLRMLRDRDQWLRLVVPRDDAAVGRVTLEFAIRDAVNTDLEKVLHALPADLNGEIAELAAFAAENLRIEGSNSPIKACLGIEELPRAEIEMVPAWRGIFALLMTKKGTVRSTVNALSGFPPAAGTRSVPEQERREEHKDRMLVVLEKIAGNRELVTALQRIELLPDEALSIRQWKLVQSFIDLLPRAAAELKVVFQERGVVDFTEMAHAARRAIGYPDAYTDLALKLDYRIHHILVDEFQDTSVTQVELLKGLTAGWEPGDGRTLFLVGDPMQSIYRFRQAEVGLFLFVEQNGIGAIKPEPVTLRKNFRSQQGIVDWVNRVFPHVFPRNSDISSGAIVYEASEATLPRLDGDAVSVHAFLENDPAAEAERIVGLVRAAAAETPGGTTAILVRSRNHLTSVLEALRDADIGYRAVEIDALRERPEVKDLYALTRALVYIADRVSWLAVLRAPWCGLRLDDLYALCADDFTRTIIEFMRDDKRVGELSGNAQLRLFRVRDVLNRALQERGRYSLRRWVEGTWIALGGPACLNNNTELQNCEIFLQLLDRLEVAGDLVRLVDLDQAVATLYAQADTSVDDSLQVMTIHKAKGLEFDTVILPGLGRTTGKSEPRLLTWLERVGPRGRAQLLLAPLAPTGEKDLVRTYVDALVAERERLEEARLIYVAATRARNRLHLLGHVMRGSNPDKPLTPAFGSLLPHLWPAISGQFTRAATDYRPAAAESADNDRSKDNALLRRVTDVFRIPPPPEPKWVQIEAGKDEEEIEYLWAQDTARHVGTVVHRALEQIGQDGPRAWRKLWRQDLSKHISSQLQALGVPFAELEAATRDCVQAIENTLVDKRGQWLFSPKHMQASSEFPVSGWLDGELVDRVLDRTFVDKDGVRWIVDYKTSTHEGGTRDEFLDNEVVRYRGQLERYARVMYQLDPMPIKVGLYFPLLKAWREWEPELN